MSKAAENKKNSQGITEKNVVFINFYMWLSLSLFIFSLWLFFLTFIQLFKKKRLSIARLFSIWFLFFIKILLLLLFLTHMHFTYNISMLFFIFILKKYIQHLLIINYANTQGNKIT